MTAGMINYYNQMCALFKACLEPSGFVTHDEDAPYTVMGLYGEPMTITPDKKTYTTTYTLDLKKLNPELTDDLDELIAEILLKKNWDENGYWNELYIEFYKDH